MAQIFHILGTKECREISYSDTHTSIVGDQYALPNVILGKKKRRLFEDNSV